MKKVNTILWGVVLIGLGIIFGLNAAGIADIDVFFPGWWTLFIIVPSAISLFTDEDKIGSLLGLTIGVLFLIGCLDVISFDIVWSLMIPLILVALGVKVILKGAISSDKRLASKRKHARKTHMKEGEVVEDENPEYWATFSGQKVSYAGKKFDGCRLEAVFGGVELDLRGAKIASDAVIKASGVFGGVKIILDKDVDVEVTSSALFGGVTNDRKNVVPGKKALLIEATCIFGGVEIK